MDWTNTRTGFPQSDRKVFSYELRRSLVIRKTVLDKIPKEWEATTDEDWETWLQSESLREDGHQAPGIGAILAGRAPDTSDDAIQGENPQLLENLPWSRGTFDRIISKFFIHGSITKSIQRPGPIFSRTHIKIGNPPEPAIVYVCRASSAWPGDIALSATHFPASGFTYAVFFGCEFSDSTAENSKKRAPATTLKSGDRVRGLLSNSEDTVAHPMLICGIFAEIELRRHMSIVGDALANLLNKVNDVSAGEGADYRALAPGPGEEDNHAIKPWLSMHVIKIKLECWLRELEKMVQHVEELSQTLYQAHEVPFEGEIDPVTFQPFTAAEVSVLRAEEDRRASSRATGVRIKERLQDMINQYREKISESMLTMEGLTLATQVAHTRANMEVALETKRDGGQMKSIALLTMVFLPATFFATFFSMSFFKWSTPEGDVVSRSIWIYVLVTLVFTGLTLGLYLWASNRQSHPIDHEP